jgi:hypothetical protein
VVALPGNWEKVAEDFCNTKIRPGQPEGARPISFKLKTKKLNSKNGKPQIIGEENSPREKKSIAQQVLCQDHA